MEKKENDLNNIHISLIENQQNQNNSLTFPVFCTFCKKSPLFQPIYYCKECKFIYCSQCEEYNGLKHNHPYYQIKNTSQYEFLNLGKESQVDKIIDEVGNKVGNAYKSVLNFFGIKSDDNENQDNDINNPYNNQNRI